MSQASSVVLPGVVRYPWGDAFPDVFIHASESAVKQHAAYSAAKAGDVSAAIALVSTTIDYAIVDQLRQLAQGHDPVLISVHAQESAGVNIIPQVLAGFLASHLGWPVETHVVQSNMSVTRAAAGLPAWRARPRLPALSRRAPLSWSTISSGRAARWRTCEATCSTREHA